MSQKLRNAELKKKTKHLLEGPLKHIRGAALTAALLPLASVAAAPASAQSVCPSGGVCGTVFNDTNNSGIQDSGESGIEGVKVTVCDDMMVCDFTYTDSTGFYIYGTQPDGTYGIFVQTPQGTQASPSNVGDDATDSDGVPTWLSGQWFSGASVTWEGGVVRRTDFGFFTTVPKQPGTGTPGYWKNHPEAWPAGGVTIGGIYYPKNVALAWLGKVGKDKTTTMFSSLVSAILNATIGNDSSCIGQTIIDANSWMATYGPVGSNVPASSYAWSVGEPLHQLMDAYNNGQLCAPHRN
jgi:hypothetical protein